LSDHLEKEGARQNARSGICTTLLALAICFMLISPCLSSTPNALHQQLSTIGEFPSREMILDLFSACCFGDDPGNVVSSSGRHSLIDLGIIVVPTLLSEFLGSDDPRSRIELDYIVSGIGNIASEYLIPYLTDSNPAKRRHAALLLADISAAATDEYPLSPGPFPEDQDVIEALNVSLQNETVLSVVGAELSSLGKMRDPGQIETLISYLHNQDEVIRISAVTALGYIPDQDVIAPLMSAFGDPLPSVRRSSVLALSSPTLGNLAFEALLGGATMSPYEKQGRRCALEALILFMGSVVGDEPRPVHQRTRAFDIASSIIKMDKSPVDWDIRSLAVDILGYSRCPEAIGVLEELANNENHRYVLERIRVALERLHAPLQSAEPE
jgi:HEAT repeat protein